MRSRGACGFGPAGVAGVLVTAFVACSIAAAAALAGPAADSAAVKLRFAQPPLSSRSLWVKWRADHNRKKGRVYTMELRLSGGGSDLCSRSRIWTIRRHFNKNDIISVRLKPLDRTLGELSLWCPGPATLRVVSTAPATAAPRMPA